MPWFRKGRKADSPMGNARPRGPAELVGDLDPGAAAVRWVYDAMRIDPEWSVWEDRGSSGQVPRRDCGNHRRRYRPLSYGW